MNVLTKELVLPANASGCFPPEKRIANEFSMPQVSRYNFILADRLINCTTLMVQALFVW